ncbi:MAG TPA: CopG family transcriptional regulator [Thermoanaerobaculia bacterium]|jgi:plasmid stability protein|nr:CopG family transcriptional regulator [Thermoanaerobaculia bacterium]
MKNITVALEEDVALWVRVRAAEQNQSVSRYLAEMLRKQMGEEKTYEEAMASFLASKPSHINDSDTYPARETLYERPRVR